MYQGLTKILGRALISDYSHISMYTHNNIDQVVHVNANRLHLAIRVEITPLLEFIGLTIMVVVVVFDNTRIVDERFTAIGANLR